MVKKWEYWHRAYDRYRKMVKLSDEENKIYVFYARTGREIENF